jgi:plasmid stabilization system protein ParE
MQKITWTLEALNDFEDYIDWYLQNANEVIAGDFIETIENALDSIKDNNYIARMVDEIPGLREYVVQQFPFLISYWVKDYTEIVITSFLHQKRKK